MDHLFKCLAALLLAFNLGVNGVIYRTVQLEAGLNAELPCHELEDVAALKMWVTPNRGFVTVDYIPDSEHYAIDANSGSLYVNNVAKEDSGNYLCISQPNGPQTEYENVTVTMKVLDVSYLPEIDDWEANLVRGIIAAVCTAAFFTGACALNHFSWHNRHHEKPELFEGRRSTASRSSRHSSTTSTAQDQAVNGIDNPALSVGAGEVESGL